MMLKNMRRQYLAVYIRIAIPLLASVVFAASSAFAAIALAETDRADLSVGMKTLPLLDDKITGTATLAIVFDPANPASKQEADDIKNILNTNFQGPVDLKLIGILVPVTDLVKIDGSRIAVLTSGLGTYYNTISDAVAGRGILTMSTDLACVTENKCILGLVSKPHVEIYYSKTAAENAKVTFGQVFALLVKEI